MNRVADRRIEVPAWRRNAEAGVALAAARAVEGPKAPSLPAELSRIIRPEAQPRWLLPSLSVITPQYLEGILRGALVGNHVFQWQLFDMMEDTWPRLVKNLNELKRAAITELLQNWRLQSWRERDTAPTPSAEEKAAVVQEALFEMPGDPAKNENDFEDTLYDMLDAWGKGTSILEIEWEVREAGGIGQIVAPRNTFWVHPKNYAWDGAGELGLVLSTPQTGRGLFYARTDIRMQEQGGLEPMVPDKFIVAISRARSGHPLGGALLRPLAWWWCAANFSADWLLNFAQVFGMPIRWATYAQGVPQPTVDAICTMLQNMGSQAWAAFPAGTALELKEAGKAGENLPQASVLDRADKQCDLLILGETLTSHLGNQESGSRALGEVHERVRDQRIHSAASFLARTLNSQVIPAVLRLNFNDESERPAFVPNEEEPEAAKANAEVLQIAIESGIPVPVDFALEKLNIPKAEEGEELVEAPAPVAANPMGGNGADGETTEGEGETTDNTDNTDKADGNGKSKSMKAQSVERGALTASDATDRVIERALEELTGVQARWLGGVKPFFRELVAKAKDGSVTDAEFLRAIERARRQIPELFGKLKPAELAKAMEAAMGSAAVNGAVKGFMGRAITKTRTRTK